MKKNQITAIAFAASVLTILCGIALAQQQDKYTVKVPGGLAFSEFRGYENWSVVATSQSANLKLVAVILANPEMIEAYQAGIPGNGKPFPDGSKIVKIEWSAKKSTESPYFVMVPDTLKSVSFIEKNSKRFRDSGGWGYAQFHYDAASDTFTPFGNDAACGYACHTAVKAKDYIFTAYPRR